MHRIKPFLRRRFVLLLAVLGFVSMLPMTRQPSFAGGCGTGFVEIFFSDASNTTVVGHCGFNCAQITTCSGTRTAYSSIAFYQCC